MIFDIRNKLNPLIYLKYKFAKYYDPTVAKLPLKTYSPFKIFRILKDNGFEIEMTIPVGFFIWILAPVIIVKAKKKYD